MPPTSDPYPSQFAIEIDRDNLRKYYRVQWLLQWLCLGFFGIYIGGFASTAEIERGSKFGWNAASIVARDAAIGMAVSLIVAILLYLYFSHRRAARYADSLEISVEGSFLRIRQQTKSFLDRKLHFRAIVDYAVTQNALMHWCCIEALQMTTMSGGVHSTIRVPGVKDCLKVRDILAEIDRLREDQ